MIQTIPCGTKVTTKTGDITGIITCCSIRFGEIRYEFSYFFNGVYSSTFLNENEIDVTTEKRDNIGFKKHEE